MNIKKNNLLWLTFILSAFFISCKKEDTSVGSSLQDVEGVFSHYTLDTLKITSGTIIKADSLYGTLGDEYVYVGKYTDTEVGTVQAESYLQIGLGGENPEFGDNIVCDSVVLQLNFTSSTEEDRIIQGNGSVINTLEVRELNEPIQPFIPNTVSLGYGDVLNTITVDAATDTSQFFSINLPTSFGISLLEKAESRSNDEFKIEFNGLALTGVDSDESIVAYDINDSDSWLTVYLHNDAIDVDDESLEYDFDLSRDTLYNHINIAAERSTSTSFSTISDELTDNSNTNNQLLLHNGIGASIILTLEDFIDQIDTTKNHLVNKAIFRLPIDANAYEEQYNEAVPYVRVIETDVDGQSLGDTISSLLTDGSFVTGGTNTIITFDEDELYYEIDLTYYFQEYLLGERSLNSFMITPNITNTTLGVERSVINADDIEFKLYYSEI